MAPRSKWTDWRPGDPTPEHEVSVGSVSPLTRGTGKSEPPQGKTNRQNRQKGGTPLLSSPATLGKRTDKADKKAEGRESGNRQNRQKEASAGVDPLDRIAELAVRHHLGQYDGTSVGRRLAHLFAAPLDQLDQTTRALLAACDFLQIDGSQLDAMNAEADPLTAGHNAACSESSHAEAAK